MKYLEPFQSSVFHPLEASKSVHTVAGLSDDLLDSLWTFTTLCSCVVHQSTVWLLLRLLQTVIFFLVCSLTIELTTCFIPTWNNHISYLIVWLLPYRKHFCKSLWLFRPVSVLMDIFILFITTSILPPRAWLNFGGRAWMGIKILCPLCFRRISKTDYTVAGIKTKLHIEVVWWPTCVQNLKS